MALPSPELAQLFQPVLEWLDQGGDERLGFNMDDIVVTSAASDRMTAKDHAGNLCNTTCCIAGAVGLLSPIDYTDISPSNHDSVQRAQWANHALVENHGMSVSDSEKMFFGWTEETDPKPADAAKVIRHWIQTGDVDWSIIGSS